MGRKGGFSHNYDAAAMFRFKADENATAELGAVVSAQILEEVDQTITRLAADIAAEHGIHEDVARLFVAQRAHEAVDFLRWVKAGEARGAGVPVRGLMDAMGYSSPTSISRMVPTLDHVVAARARVDASGETEDILDDRGYTITLTPRQDGTDTVSEARRRGIIADEES